MSLWLLADVAGARTYERAAAVLFDGVADPTHRPAYGEERDSPTGRRPGCPSQGGQPKVQRRAFAYEVQGLFGNGVRERNCGAMRAVHARQPEQLEASGVPAWVKGVPETRHALTTFETTGDRLPRITGGFDLSQECLDQLGLPAVLCALQGRQTGRYHTVWRSLGRGNAAGSKRRDVQLVIRAQD